MFGVILSKVRTERDCCSGQARIQQLGRVFPFERGDSAEEAPHQCQTRNNGRLVGPSISNSSGQRRALIGVWTAARPVTVLRMSS